MDNKWYYTEDLIEEFKMKNKNKEYIHLDAVEMDINPKNIIAINNTYGYPEILNDYKMKRLKTSYKENSWLDNSRSILTFSLLMLPNGDLLVNGGGNHRAVLAKEEGLESVRALVSRVIYKDYHQEV